jgi:hypothetical protein
LKSVRLLISCDTGNKNCLFFPVQKFFIKVSAFGTVHAFIAYRTEREFLPVLISPILPPIPFGSFSFPDLLLFNKSPKPVSSLSHLHRRCWNRLFLFLNRNSNACSEPTLKHLHPSQPPFWPLSVRSISRPTKGKCGIQGKNQFRK